jgi:hypothetical protein
VVSVTDLHGLILGFLDRSPYFFFQVAPQLYSLKQKKLLGLSSRANYTDRIPDPLLLRKSGSAGNRTRISGSVASEFDH